VGAFRRSGTALAVIVVGAVAIVGCGSSDAMPPEAADQPLPPDETGRVDRTATGTTGIEGGWFVFSDSTNPEGVPPGDCQRGGHDIAQCSAVIMPDPATREFPPTVVNDFVLGNCVVGVAARIIADANGSPDSSHIWGFGIGLSFNGGQPYYDAPAHQVTGVAFDIDSEPPPRGGIRVTVPTEATAILPAWWGGATEWTSPVHAGHNEFRWGSVGGPRYSTSPPPFDPTRILGISFQVVADTDGPETASFCISNLAALRN
jgi:hypothetical protein